MRTAEEWIDFFDQEVRRLEAIGGEKQTEIALFKEQQQRWRAVGEPARHLEALSRRPYPVIPFQDELDDVESRLNSAGREVVGLDQV